MRIFRRRGVQPMDRSDVVTGAAAKQPAKPKPTWPQDPVRCPQCGGTDLFWSLTCHTYSLGQGEEKRWKACLPCDSAVRYACAEDECDWDYTHGLNPDNPRAAINEEYRPAWLPEKLAFTEHSFPAIHPRVREIGVHGDDD